MGCYDTFGTLGIQLKNGECVLNEFSIGDKVNLSDGIYVGFGGFVVIYNGIFVAEIPGDTIIDKWGQPIQVNIDERNPSNYTTGVLVRDYEKETENDGSI
jgi:hypothetical protein